MAAVSVVVFLLAAIFLFPRESRDSRWDPWYTPIDLGSGPVQFKYFPIPENEIKWIIPLGNVNNPEHPIPTDHMYYLGIRGENFPWGARPGPHEVRAPADGFINWINWTTGYSHDLGKSFDDFMVVIIHSNNLISVLGHVYDIDNRILEEAMRQGLRKGKDYGDYMHVWIPVRAGQTIGRATGGDFGAYDKTIVLTNLIHPERYKPYAFFLHTVNPLDYYEENLREFLYQKCWRVGEPRGGKIDYDIPGRLIGNWFLKPWKEEYVMRGYGMLSFAPSVYDSSKIRIGFGRGFGVPDNLMFTYENVEGPDPATVTVQSGPVVYYLSNPVWREVSGKWTWVTVKLTILVQMVSDEEIKVEWFEGHVENPSFTSKAKHYTR